MKKKKEPLQPHYHKGERAPFPLSSPPMAELQDFSFNHERGAAPDTSITHKYNDPSSTSSSTTAFMYKAILFLAAVVLFPSHAPEFLQQTLLTRSWELLHLLLVGIAVSYGLFSRKNPSPNANDKEASTSPAKQPAASSSYLSHMNLQVASVFDDDEDAVDARAQMWSSRYYSGAPAVVVAQAASDSGKNPLCLPVRSLRSSQVPPPLEPVHPGEYFDSGGSMGTGWAGDLGEDGDAGRGRCPQLEEESAAVVLPSPIPWRSRTSGSPTEPKLAETSSRASPTPPPPPSRASSLLPPAADADLQGGFRTQSFRTRRLSVSRSPSPSPSLSPEPRARTGEEMVRRRGTHKSGAPPPPPPPPPPPFHPIGQRSQLYYSARSRTQLRRSFTDELKHLSRSGGRETPPLPRPSSTSPLLPTEKPTTPPRPPPVPPPKKEERRMAWGTANRMYRPLVAKKAEEEEEERQRRSGFSRKKFVMDSDDDSDTESGGGSESSSEAEDASSSVTTEAEAEAEAEREGGGNEVDKKADEFIAKFREQIRLQRIESIKRSTGHRSIKNSK